MAELCDGHVLRLPGWNISPFKRRQVVDAAQFVDCAKPSVDHLCLVISAGGRVTTEQAIKGFLLGMSKTRQDSQAQVLQAVLSRGPGLLQALDVSRHLFLAQQVGRQGSREGARLLRQAWSEVNLSEPTQLGLMGWVGRHALLGRQESVWQEVEAWPGQAEYRQLTISATGFDGKAQPCIAG